MWKQSVQRIASARHVQMQRVVPMSSTSMNSPNFLSPHMYMMKKHFAAQPMEQTNTSDFRVVPFIKEDMQKVSEEVPNFKYYSSGEDAPKTNIYANLPLDQPAISTSEYPPYQPVDSSLKLSKLENGLRIASMDKGGLTCLLGLFVNAGSRFEDPTNYGVSHMIENMAFHSTAHLSWLRTVKTLETLGVNAQCNIGRELIIYSAEGLRDFMPILIPILTGNVLFPRFLPWEIKNNADRLAAVRDSLNKNSDALVTELLHTTAWQNNTLGNKLYASEKSLSYYNGDCIREFMLQHFSPDNMVFVGVNVDHDELCKWLMRAFVDYNAIPPQPKKQIKPIYTGGDCRVEGASPLAHLAIAFETPGGWNSESLVAMTLLQTLLGGGGSFSTGGPGKGMYTQLFLNVLNRNDWVETCMAFNSQYTDSGLFGIYMTAHAMQGAAMVRVIVEELKKMGTVTKQELQRAKNALKSSIWMNLEFRPVIMEDVARQMIMSGKIKSPKEFCAEIDAITEMDLKRVAASILSKVPTVVAYGDISTIPHYEEIADALRSAKSPQRSG